MSRASDEAQLRYASSREWVIISYDYFDYERRHAEAVRQERPHGGIILLPGHGPLERKVIRAAMMLDWLGTLPDYRLQLFKWGDLQSLLTRGFRLPGYPQADVRLALGHSQA